MENDLSYYTRRAAEERSAANATQGPVRDAHLEMARRYEERLHSAKVAARRSAMHAVASEAPTAAA